MANSACFPVVEQFVSVNGEGLESGRPAAFIRFAGCNLDCAYCDTRWANGADAVAAAELRSAEELVDWVRSTGVSAVTLTGGEPLLQTGLPDLVQQLMAVDDPHPLRVEVETNGSCNLTPLLHLREDVQKGRPKLRCAKGAPQIAPARSPDAQKGRPKLHIEKASQRATSDPMCNLERPFCTSTELPGSLHLTVDWKTPAAGADACERMLPSTFAELDERDAVKFVIGSVDDVAFAAKCAAEAGLFGRCAVLVSPVWGSVDPADVADALQRSDMHEARLQLQLHKILWPNTSRGV